MHFHVGHLIQHYGYGGVFLILLFEMIGIPFPAETTLTISGIFMQQGKFAAFPLLLMAVLGNVAGSTIAYAVGKYFGRTILLRFGKYIGITEERLSKAEQLFKKRRIFILVAAKFIAGIRVFIPYLAGINDVPFWIFSFYNTISAIIWVSVFVFLGKNVDKLWKHYHVVIQQHLLLMIIAAVIIIGLFVWLKIWQSRKKKADNP